MPENEQPPSLAEVLQCLQEMRGRNDFLQGQIEGVQAVLCECLRPDKEVRSRVEDALRERIRWMKEADPAEDAPATIAGVETVLNGLLQLSRADYRDSSGKSH